MNADKKSYFSSKIQEVHASLKGEIISSSDTLFTIENGQNLYELHPFFESLEDVFNDPGTVQKNLAFPCVKIVINDVAAICDITITKERGELAILFFDYSQHYVNLHEAAHEKKTAMLQEQEFELSQKHMEEKKAYLGFMKDRIDDKLINSLAYVVSKVEELKTSQLTAEQRIILDKIEQNIGGFHLRAIQIREELDFDFDE